MSTAYTILADSGSADSFDWKGHDIKAALVSNSISYTPDKDNDKFITNVLDGSTAKEFSGSNGNYSRQSLGSKTRTDVSPDKFRLNAADVNFGILDGDTIQGVLIYDNTNGVSLVCYLDGGDFPYTTDGTEDITISFPSNGIVVYDV
jgi:hypothetical protein